jgi:hypothetical protein
MDWFTASFSAGRNLPRRAQVNFEVLISIEMPKTLFGNSIAIALP